MIFKKACVLTFTVLILSGCADHSDKIQASYVSPMQYQDYSCHQIRSEVARVSHKVNEIAGVQDKTATNDAWATGVGVVLFWPALFFIAHDDQHTQLAELKGQYDALQEVAIKKNCDIVKEMKAAEQEAKKRAKDQQDQEQSSKKNFNE